MGNIGSHVDLSSWRAGHQKNCERRQLFPAELVRSLFATGTGAVETHYELARAYGANFQRPERLAARSLGQRGRLFMLPYRNGRMIDTVLLAFHHVTVGRNSVGPGPGS
jgi:hypothetical protein